MRNYWLIKCWINDLLASLLVDFKNSLSWKDQSILCMPALILAKLLLILLPESSAYILVPGCYSLFSYFLLLASYL